ncbi:MAG: hypothetical protein KJ574_03780, partial [Nanoarchaeota archaeon]|nr:hypothetical protein [Nanoarchaeota archaeon]
EEMIKKHLNIRPEQPKTEAQEVQREALQTAPIAAETKIFPEQKTLPTQQIHTPQTDVMQEQKKEPQKVPETIPEAKLDEEIKKVEEEIEEELDKLEEKPKAKPSKPRARSLQKKTPEEVQETLGKELVLPEDDELFQRVDAFFKNNHIEITAIDVIRKESEIDFIIDLPTNLGAVKYFCKVKSKQKINDGDLSSAYIQGQIKKMPILFLTFGELTTKAKQLLSTEFKTMFVRKID